METQIDFQFHNGIYTASVPAKSIEELEDIFGRIFFATNEYINVLHLWKPTQYRWIVRSAVTRDIYIATYLRVTFREWIKDLNDVLKNIRRLINEESFSSEGIESGTSDIDEIAYMLQGEQFQAPLKLVALIWMR